jgi:hypothetical protein
MRMVKEEKVKDDALKLIEKMKEGFVYYDKFKIALDTAAKEQLANELTKYALELSELNNTKELPEDLKVNYLVIVDINRHVQ